MLRMTPLSIGTSTSAMRAMCIRARRSFGRHDPPNENPGRRYAAEMLRRWSSQKTRITSRASTSTAESSRPISFAKVIFTAWYALHAYLSDSAASIDIAWSGLSIGRECPRHEPERAVIPDASGRERRGEEVVHAAPLAEELRNHPHAEVVVRPATRHLFEHRSQAPVDRAGRDRAAVDDREERRAVGDDRAELLCHALDEDQVDRPSLRAGVPTDTRTMSASRADAARSDDTCESVRLPARCPPARRAQARRSG